MLLAGDPDRSPRLCGLRMAFLPQHSCLSIAASWLGVSPWLLRPLTSELESLDLPKRSSLFAFSGLTFWNWTWEYPHNHFPLAKRQMGGDGKGGERQKERESAAEKQLCVIINYRHWFWGERPSHRLSGKPIFPFLALWVSLRLKVSPAAWIQFSMPPMYESWVGALTAEMCPVLVSKLSQSQVWLCRTDLSAQLLRFTTLFLQCLHWVRQLSCQVHFWTAQSSLKKKFCISCLAWNDLYIQLDHPSVDICPGSPDLAENLRSVFLLHQRGTFKASD